MHEVESIARAGGNVQKSPSSKAAAIWTRGAYIEYVSTAKWRERRWRLFSTFPFTNNKRRKTMGNPLDTISGTITAGFVLTVVLYALVKVLV